MGDTVLIAVLIPACTALGALLRRYLDGEKKRCASALTWAEPYFGATRVTSQRCAAAPDPHCVGKNCRKHCREHCGPRCEP